MIVITGECCRCGMFGSASPGILADGNTMTAYMEVTKMGHFKVYLQCVNAQLCSQRRIA